MDGNLFCISAADSCGSLSGSLGHVVSFINQTWQGGVSRSQQVNALGFLASRTACGARRCGRELSFWLGCEKVEDI